jgi:hypothetical protein
MAKEEIGWSSDEELEQLIRYAERTTGDFKEEKTVRVDADKIYPYPEIVRKSAVFKISGSKDELAGATNLTTRDMVVPLGDTEQAAAVRDHENDHVALSERRTAEQDELGFIMSAIEDGRIGMMKKAAGWEFLPDPVVADLPKVLKKMKDMTAAAYDPDSKINDMALTLALGLLASQGNNRDLSSLKGAVKESLDPIKGKKKVPHWNKAVRLANRLAGQALAVMGKPETAPHLGCTTCRRRKRKKQRPVPCVHPKRALAAAKWLEEWRVKQGAPKPRGGSGMSSGCCGRKPGKPELEGRGGGKPYSYQYNYSPGKEPSGKKLDIDNHWDEWGTMSVQTPPRNHRALPKSKVAPLVYSRKMGVVPDRMHNWCTGRKVFSWVQPTGQKGGSILIDASGSMRFSREALLAFVKAAPAVTVAAYAGAAVDTGTLRVYIKNGKIVADEYLDRPDTGNNIVDGPAIRWLSEQKGPRFWITDLGVTGRLDIEHSTYYLRDECIRFCKRNTIVIIPSLDRAEKALVKHYGGK